MDLLCDLLKANTNTIIWCDTYEFGRFIGDISTIVNKYPEKLGNNLKISDIYCWDASLGLTKFNSMTESFVGIEKTDIEKYRATLNPSALLKTILSEQMSVNSKARNQNSGIPLFILKNFHMFNRATSAPNVVQGLLNLRESSKKKIPVIIVGPAVDIPEEESKLFTMFNYELPDEEEIKNVIGHVAKQINCRNAEKEDGKPQITKEDIDKLVTASKGLTYNEIDDCCRKSIVANGTLDPDTFKKEKINIVKKSGCLDFRETKASTFNDMGGNEEFKKWILEEKELFNPKAQEFGLDMPKGYICFGPAGSGKSASAEMTASLFGVPLLELNFSKIMGSLVGQSERAIDMALSVAKAVSPCVLLLDECEKVLGGYASSNQSDSGTLSRVLGRLLSFMQDDNSGVFVVMTSNDITKLPPELMRSGRLDAQWYFGLPNMTERKSILNVYLNKNHKTLSKDLMNHAIMATNHFTGAEIKLMVSIMMRKLWIRYMKDNTVDTKTFIKEDIDAAVSEIVPVYNYASDIVLELQQYAKNRARFASKSEETSAKTIDSLIDDISF